MTEKRTTKTKMESFKSVDWIDKGIKIFALIATAYASGYVSTIAAEHRSARKAKKLSEKSDSNVLMLDNKKAANN